MYAYYAWIKGHRKCYFIFRSQHTSSQMMLSLIRKSFKAGGNVLFSNFLVSASADTKVKMYKSLLAWGRGRRAVHQPSGEASTHILESVDAGIPGPLGGRKTSLCKHLLSVCSACSLFHLTWPCVLEQLP